MPYIDLAGLSRYASRQKERLERDCALLRDMQWTRSEKAGAVSLWPVGGTQLKPVVDFLFTEVPPASGDKGPENPSTISGVSEVNVTRCGKNILAPRSSGTTTSNNVSITSNGDGSYTFNSPNGASTGQVFYQLPRFGENWFQQGISFTFSCETESQSTSWQMWVANSAYGGGYFGRSPSVITPTKTLVSSVAIYIPPNVTLDNVTLRPQIELGSVKTSFEKGVGNAYTLPLGNTYYGGTLDAASGVMTVTHGLLSLNSSQSWAYTTQEKEGLYRYQYRFAFPKDGGSDGRGDICSHFIYSVATGEDAIVSWHHSKAYLYIKTSLSTVDDLKTWFTSQTNNNTPVCVAYELATPLTVQLDPVSISALAQSDKYTPRLNTVYTDAQAVQVGYVKSPIREEYELTQAITAQGGNV